MNKKQDRYVKYFLRKWIEKRGIISHELFLAVNKLTEQDIIQFLLNRKKIEAFFNLVGLCVKYRLARHNRDLVSAANIVRLIPPNVVEILSDMDFYINEDSLDLVFNEVDIGMNVSLNFLSEKNLLFVLIFFSKDEPLPDVSMTLLWFRKLARYQGVEFLLN